MTLSREGARSSRGERRRLRDVFALDDFEVAARGYLPRPIYGYISTGSETEATFRDNRAAFSEYLLRPRALVDISGRHQRTQLFGVDYNSPFGISPMGFSAVAAYQGDIVLAKTAARLGFPMIMSGASMISMERVAAAAPGKWFQSYLPGDKDAILALLGRIGDAGFENLVVTVDCAVTGNRDNCTRAGFTHPLKPSLGLAWDGIKRPGWTIGTFLRTLVRQGLPHFENAGIERGPPVIARRAINYFEDRGRWDWSLLKFVREHWKGKLVVKGILLAEDATMCADLGIDGVILSNHGGRQLDGSPSPLRTLPSVVEAVGRQMPVMMDGGIRRGTDVIKALALGASFVFVGRPFLYAAAIAGEAGVERAYQLLANEIDCDIALLGIKSLSDLKPDCLMRR